MTDFQKGTRVRNSGEWDGKPFVGAIAGEARTPECVSVAVDGRKRRQTFHCRFLAPEGLVDELFACRLMRAVERRKVERP